MFSRFFYAGREFQGARDVTEMIYSQNISAFFDKNNLQIVTNFTSVFFNTQVKALKHYVYLSTFRDFMLASLLHHNEAFKGLAVEANMITAVLIQAADVLGISSDNLKAWGEKFK